jgi:hypothetical protein
MSNFRRFVQTRYAPLVEVVAHPDVVAGLAEREGLTPAALFRPAGSDGVALNGACDRVCEREAHTHRAVPCPLCAASRGQWPWQGRR